MPIFVHKFYHALVRYCTDLIFPSEREKLIGNLSPSPWIPVQMTVTVTEQETIFIRNCVQGFVCIGEPKTTSSEDMFACVNENYLTNHKSKFVGFGCDGASNMMGCKTSLVTRLQECYPEVEDIGNDVLGSPIHTNPWTQFLINIVSCSVTQSLSSVLVSMVRETNSQ
jgi:hypothetical protein